MKDLEEWMRKESSCLDIIVCVSSEMMAWRVGAVKLPAVYLVFEEVDEGQEYQSRSGWRGAVEGYFRHR